MKKQLTISAIMISMAVFAGPDSTATDDTHQKHVATEQFYASFYGGDARAILGDRARFRRVFWDVGMTYTLEKCEVTFNMYPADNIGVTNHGGRGRLRSTTGRPEGPYESLGRIAGHYADSGDGPEPEPFMGYDGKKYVQAKLLVLARTAQSWAAKQRK